MSGDREFVRVKWVRLMRVDFPLIEWGFCREIRSYETHIRLTWGFELSVVYSIIFSGNDFRVEQTLSDNWSPCFFLSFFLQNVHPSTACAIKTAMDYCLALFLKKFYNQTKRKALPGHGNQTTRTTSPYSHAS